LVNGSAGTTSTAKWCFISVSFSALFLLPGKFILWVSGVLEIPGVNRGQTFGSGWENSKLSLWNHFCPRETLMEMDNTPCRNLSQADLYLFSS